MLLSISLNSDGDGRTLAQELFTDGSDPFEADTSNSQYRRQKVEELEL
ncbi:hypothetical protein COO91_10441 (plasmid) [Nostoc flagelliforme CCNUN1]|uniref:Uncharacterized protein n=1 Tax=Nostoc flagelliforme CCNUN1 TaxID=2038116 RepID=A0A2K8T946_9NOSO|nr:hypothetical protein [Nostoc flagelliforme]AUB44218.1 hypothetical protein COO91_10441 [Nostoc flagelliforme CCNUN1]